VPRALPGVERDLADRLRSAPRADRRRLTSQIYDELFRRVQHHPQRSLQEKPPQHATAKVLATSRCLRSPAPSRAALLEVDQGDCHLSMVMARHAQRVYAIDVSDAITRTD
jgi:hypothetical protein